MIQPQDVTHRPRRAIMRLAIVSTMLLLAACAPMGPTSPLAKSAQGASPQSSTVQRPLVVTFSSEVDVLEPSMNSGSGNRDVDALTNSFLAYMTPQQQPMPFLAEELPSIDKGTWRVFEDGHMETTYKLK